MLHFTSNHVLGPWNSSRKLTSSDSSSSSTQRIQAGSRKRQRFKAVDWSGLCYKNFRFLSLRKIVFTSRNHVRRRLIDESNINPNDSFRQVQSCGLECSTVQALPMSQFKKNEGKRKPTNVDYAICLGEFEEGEWLKHLTNCT
ncbi:RING-type E3 ubiquitin transferase [Trifolium repens]|nr:RING-type E3 ubiquitin transferase [Trifolium repens]